MPTSATSHTNPTALIAEDEPLLAAALQAELAAVWPELKVLGHAPDGLSAVQQALSLLPDVLFFDIRMPGQSGLDAAAALAHEWEDATDKPFPLLVFVTAYDQYAVAAFEAQAVDYVVKPVQRARLEKTVNKLASSLNSREQFATNSGLSNSATPALPATDDPYARLAALLAGVNLAQAGLAVPPHGTHGNGASGAAQATGHLRMIQASQTTAQGTTLVMVPVEEVSYFEAADKYVRVVCPTREVLIRTPLKELLPQLDAHVFWQIHRGTVVRSTAIRSATRDEAGKLWLHLADCPDKLVVSRLYQHLFKAM